LTLNRNRLRRLTIIFFKDIMMQTCHQQRPKLDAVWAFANRAVLGASLAVLRRTGD
jgi:hypothetical protein